MLVGPDKVKWALPENVLCSCSDFFKQALRGQFKESSGHIELPEDDPVAFEHFIRSVYSVHMGNQPEAQLRELPTSQVIDVYLLAYKYLNVIFQDASIGVVWRDLKADCLKSRSEYYSIVDVFAKTLKSSKMRLLLARSFVYRHFCGASSGANMPEWCEKIVEHGNAELNSILLKEVFRWIADYQKKTGLIKKPPTFLDFVGCVDDFLIEST